ncbi:MAG TPA: PAS domain S-box protein, partial [Dehalococcoidia bacterium]|nr:PAS domain S-box protein [Dehalococcoidia bacterium]
MNKGPRNRIRIAGGPSAANGSGGTPYREQTAVRPSGEDKYRQLFNDAVFGIFQTTADGHFLDANNALAHILGYESREELITGVNDIPRQVHVDQERRAEFSRLLEEQGLVRGFEAEVYRKDGSKIWVSLSARVVANNVYEGIAEDITDRKETEAALRSSEERFYKAFHASPAAKSIVIAGDGRFIDVNDRFLALLGYTRSELIGHTADEIGIWVDPADRERFTEELDKNGSARDIETRFRTKDGTDREVLGSAVIVHVGGELCVLSLLYDITERKAAEAALTEQQTRLDLALQAGRMGTWDWDIAAGKVHWSETLEAIHGLAPGEFGGSFEDYTSDIHPDDRPQVIESISRALESGHHDIEYRIIWPDGSEHWIAAKGELTRNAAGQPQRMTGLCMDITERKRIEDRARFLSDATALLAASSLDDTMTLASLARLAVPWLGDWCDISVLQEDGSLKQLALAHHDDERLQLAKALQERYPFDPDVSFGLAHVLRTGRAEYYPDISLDSIHELIQDEDLFRAVADFGVKSVICAPLVARGRTLGAITLATAESGRRYTEADFVLAEELGRRAGLALDNARLYADLIKANEAKDEFLGLMSHELRTPITTIYGGARMLRSRADRLEPEVKDRLLADVEQESERLFRMVEDLLALARTELGQTVTIEPVMAQRIIEKVAASFMQRRPGRPLDVVADAALAPIAAQPTYVEQVLRNMLSNADKYSPVGKPIDIYARAVDKGVEVSVRDRGSGITEEEVELIFERF